MAAVDHGRELTLEVPSTHLPFYSSITLSTSTLDLNSTAAFSPRTLYAQSFDHPYSSPNLPSSSYARKNVKTMTGYTTTEDEFNALPMAVRRKYFSTLERLRIAQNSRSKAINELPIQRNRKGSLADRRGVTVPVIDPPRKGLSTRKLRRSTRISSISSSADTSWFLTLPEKIQKKQFTREEQVVLAGRLRESVILDAADEAINKASRRASRNLTPVLAQDSSRESLDTYSRERKEPSMADTIYDSFRWMDEEEDLDLKLSLDDYHANLDGVVIPTPDTICRPSFRRQMSISKRPFGRSSLSSLQGPRSPKIGPTVTSHSRQKSRTLSLIGGSGLPKHGIRDSISSIDPNATHYQDPEARLKLRVYLASPQKFDEAIEFGFPSKDGVTTHSDLEYDKENKPPRLSLSHTTKRSQSTDLNQSFLLNDFDDASLFEEDTSMLDPESPLTPMEKEMGFRPSPYHSTHRPLPSISSGLKNSSEFAHLGITKPSVNSGHHKPADNYNTQLMAGSREMTLRMTLTRPDLRADETTLYGWQNLEKKGRGDEEKEGEKIGGEDMRGPLGGLDGWDAGPERDSSDPGVVKRFWMRVRSSQRNKS